MRACDHRTERVAFARLAVVCVALVIAGCSSDVLPRTEHTSGPSTIVPGTTASPASPTTSTSSTTSTTTTIAPPRVVRLAFTGDSMAHDAVSAQARRNADGLLVAYDYAPMWQQLAPIVGAADLAVCHLETTVGADGDAPTGFPRFRVPHEYIEAIAGVGYDACSTASNHAFDYGVDGITRTIEALEQNGLGWAGTARSADEAAQPHIYDAAGVRVALISATYGLNGFRLPADQPWLVDAIDVPLLLDRARAAREAGADIVVVSMHCCAEYRGQPTDPQVEWARALIESPDVDLVVGHHAHVVQPIERVGDEYVVYGLGNILSNMYASRCCPAAAQDGVVVGVTFTEGPDGRFTTSAVDYTPTWVDRTGGFVITPVVAALTDPALDPARRSALEASLARTVDAINARGAADAGVTLAG